MKPIQVKVTKYQAKDGEIFDTPDEAIHHEKLLLGERKTCFNCKGKKRVDLYGDGRILTPCNTCKGKGYLDKKEKWE